MSMADGAADPRALAEATLAWWRDAGVDIAFDAPPRRWLAERTAEAESSSDPQSSAPAARRSKAPAAPPPPPRLGGDRAQWPTVLEAFTGWWLTEPTLDDRPAARRVPPAGAANAELMVVVPAPEAGDDTVLLAGPCGRLLDAMLAAMGLGRDRVYLASALTAPTPMPDWEALAAAGLGQVLAHHVTLAAPRRVLVMGDPRISALLGHDPAKTSALSLRFNHQGGSVPVAYAHDLETLLLKPALKAGVWRRWLDWTGNAT